MRCSRLSHWDKVQRKTQDKLDGLCLLAGLGRPWDFPRGTGTSGCRGKSGSCYLDRLLPPQSFPDKLKKMAPSVTSLHSSAKITLYSILSCPSTYPHSLQGHYLFLTGSPFITTQYKILITYKGLNNFALSYLINLQHHSQFSPIRSSGL